MSYININIEEFVQLNVNEQIPNKRKNTEEYVCTLLETQFKRNKIKKEIIKRCNQYVNKELWINNLTELKTFIDLNERRPVYNKEIEKVKYSWVSSQLNNRKAEKYIMLNADVKNTWDSFVKDYKQHFISNKELWTNNLTNLKSFIDLNKRRPYEGKETEKVLSRWLYTQLKNRKAKKDIMHNEDIIDLWDSFIKNYEQYFLSNEELWTSKLDELKSFIDLTERKPSLIKETEKVLYSWMNTQLKNRKIEKQIMLNTDIRNTWDNFIKNYKQYFLSNEELWNNNLIELKTFIDLNERRPNKKKKTEKTLGSWLCTQLGNRKAEKDIMHNEDIRGSWDSFIKNYKQYFLSNEELWINRLTELKTFIDLNELRPSEGKETEEVLGIWLNCQLENRKKEKNNMFNKDIKNTWDSFIKDYNQYF